MTGLRGTARKCSAFLFGVLLVTSASLGAGLGPGGQFVEPAAAQDDDEPIIDTCKVGPFTVAASSWVGQAACDQANTEELAGADANETKKEIYRQASIQGQNNHVLLTSFENYLDDTSSIALMEGKNAYIRALNNGSNKTVALGAADDAIEEYYAVKQRNLISSWETNVELYTSAQKTGANTTGMTAKFVGPANENLEYYETELADPWNESLTLLNGTTVDYVALNGRIEQGGSSQSGTIIELTSGERSFDGEQYSAFAVEAANSSLENLEFWNFAQYESRWSEIGTQSTDVKAQIETFVNNTFDSYQQGDINSTELVDPYLGARDYSAENASQFQSWALRSLTALGLDSPDNLSSVGRMNVSANGSTYTGILMSDGNPDGGFTVGETYNATNLTGLQFVALDDGGTHELTGEFTLESATGADGTEYESGENITYTNITYETAGTEEFKALQDQLDNLSAEINARQQRLRNSGGGGGLFPGFDFSLGGGLGVPTIALIAGGAGVLILSRN